MCTSWAGEVCWAAWEGRKRWRELGQSGESRLGAGRREAAEPLGRREKQVTWRKEGGKEAGWAGEEKEKKRRSLAIVWKDFGINLDSNLSCVFKLWIASIVLGHSSTYKGAALAYVF